MLLFQEKLAGLPWFSRWVDGLPRDPHRAALRVLETSPIIVRFFFWASFTIDCNTGNGGIGWTYRWGRSISIFFSNTQSEGFDTKRSTGGGAVPLREQCLCHRSPVSDAVSRRYSAVEEREGRRVLLVSGVVGRDFRSFTACRRRSVYVSCPEEWDDEEEFTSASWRVR